MSDSPLPFSSTLLTTVPTPLPDPVLLTRQTNTPTLIQSLLHSMAQLHASCITTDHTVATFLPPLDLAQMSQWWTDRLAEVGRGSRHIILQLDSPLPSPDGSSSTTISSSQPSNTIIPSGTNDSNPPQVIGIVALSTPFTQTVPHQGHVEKLLVSPLHRQRGIARRLLRRLEAVAIQHQRWLLLLDTELGSPAERVYPRLGYTRIGEVPGFMYSPDPAGPGVGEYRGIGMADAVLFYKVLEFEGRGKGQGLVGGRSAGL